ncbi:hypothetical protein SLS55_010210 [Diplodia seriata]|uniref:Uncharacterized protein n=1 Tax=Diplodia seriata TaxID=420778 RepID=A0ABR3BXW7_9PEZI
MVGPGLRGRPRNGRQQQAHGPVTGEASNRITKRTSARGGSAQRSRRPNVQKAYAPPEYPLKESVRFDSIQEWEDGQSKLVNGIKQLNFYSDFPILDEHLNAIVNLGPAFCHSLLDFRAGDAEEGTGGRLSDAAVIRFAKACPNLVHVKFDGATKLTDDALLALFTNCPSLRYICFAGNDKASGSLEGSALDVLRETRTMGKELVKLRLTDHGCINKTLDAAVKALSKSRKKLPIEIGNTDERDGEVNTWLGGKEKYGFQQFGASGPFIQLGGYFGLNL